MSARVNQDERGQPATAAVARRSSPCYTPRRFDSHLSDELRSIPAFGRPRDQFPLCVRAAEESFFERFLGRWSATFRFFFGHVVSVYWLTVFVYPENNCEIMGRFQVLGVDNNVKIAIIDYRVGRVSQPQQSQSKGWKDDEPSDKKRLLRIRLGNLLRDRDRPSVVDSERRPQRFAGGSLRTAGGRRVVGRRDLPRSGFDRRGGLTETPFRYARAVARSCDAGVFCAFDLSV